MVPHLSIGILSFIALHVSMLFIMAATNVTLVIIVAIYTYLRNPSRLYMAVVLLFWYVIWLQMNKKYITFM